MDTPQKNLIGTPGSKIEESPVFNYLSNLSPIKPVKSVHISQSFTSLSFTSPSSVFTSPQVVSSFKDSLFLKSHKFSDRSVYVKSDVANKDKSSKKLTGSSQLSENADKKEFDLENPVDEVPKDLSHTLEYDYGTPASESNSHLYTEQQNRDSAEAPGSHAYGPGSFKESSCISDGALGTYQNTPQRERLRLHWDTLATDTPGSLFMGTPSETRAFQGLFDKSLNTGDNPGSLSSLFPDNNNDLQLAQPLCQTDSDRVDMSQQVHPAEHNESEHLDWPPESIPTSLDEHTDNLSSANTDDQSVLLLHQGVRRRCLTFESLSWQKKSSSSVANQLSSVTLKSEEKGISKFKRSVLRKPVSGCSSKSVIPGIGLHLNALATAKVEHIVLPPRVEISSSSSASLFCPPATFEESLSESLHASSSLKDAGSSGKDSQLSEDDLQAIVPSEDLSTTSPRKKRPKLNGGDDESCKRCNCKKSKCLKLYCECFAAGVYCIEPCSCQDCFNQPTHEETVLATRRQIEARNPLAFAPKVIRASQATPDVGVELANTPASARHKRGCNCKKSSCLKKYCECYQGGVGCSFNCRCESCKNTFGRKDGLEVDLGIRVNAEITEEEEPQATEENVADEDSQKAVVHINEERNVDGSFQATPSRLSRLSVKLQFPSKGKPMRSSFLSIGSSTGSLNDTRNVKLSSIPLPPKFEKSQPSSIHSEDIPELLQNQDSPSNVIKTNSPNSKRVSPPQCESTRPSPSRRSTRRLILQAIPSFPSLNQQ